MAPAQFGGSYRLGPSELADGSAPVSAEITINVTDGSVTVATDCRTYLGSFTLGGEGERGTASFTLPGLGPTDCPTDLLEADSGLINALEVVTAWEIDENDSLVLTSPAGDRLVLQGSG